MADKFLSYKTYSGTIEASLEDGCLHGRLLFINDIITYEGDTISALNTAFQQAVDRYLDYCASTGRPADKPYSGTFNVRIGEDRHRKLAQKAALCGCGINEAICQALDAWLSPTGSGAAQNQIHGHIEAFSEMVAAIPQGDVPIFRRVSNVQAAKH
ncbi:MAG: type II toxin-antitoxin system HicB family antitoxin [Rhodocyclaceae bacterium]|nr:type II toxin-antitoxin system HicB family antitoxin [Rhodocyclaceae bacterium]